MELTLTLTAAEKEALIRAFPDCTLEEAVSMLVKAEMKRRYRIALKKGRVVFLQGLKKD